MNATPSTADPPRFCPDCARPAGPHDRLCRYCGSRCEPQGYCGVCEAFWPQPVGSRCPKHDLPLEPGSLPRPDLRPAGGRPDWRTVARYASAAQAQGPRLRLEAEGIPTFLDGLRMATALLGHPVVGGVKLQVPADLVDEARILLDQTWDVPPAPDDLEDAWDELAPEPGARRRAVMRWAIILMLALPLLPFLVELVAALFRA
jgi:hypothetical protein